MTVQPKIIARSVLLQSAQGRPVARGIVSIDARGAPAVIAWDVGVFLFDHVDGAELIYREAQPYRPGDSFKAVP